jgi:hypothetical protein
MGVRAVLAGARLSSPPSSRQARLTTGFPRQRKQLSHCQVPRRSLSDPPVTRQPSQLQVCKLHGRQFGVRRNSRFARWFQLSRLMENKKQNTRPCSSQVPVPNRHGRWCGRMIDRAGWCYGCSHPSRPDVSNRSGQIQRAWSTLFSAVPSPVFSDGSVQRISIPTTRFCYFLWPLVFYSVCTACLHLLIRKKKNIPSCCVVDTLLRIWTDILQLWLGYLETQHSIS